MKEVTYEKDQLTAIKVVDNAKPRLVKRDFTHLFVGHRQIVRLASGLQTIVHQYLLVASLTLVRARLATSRYVTSMKNCFKDWSQSSN